MKQVLQNYNSGELLLADVPEPVVTPGRVLVRNTASLVSAGTERQMIDLAKKSLLGKALARPDLVKKVIALAKTEGIQEAYQVSKSRLDAPVPLGYSSAGRVVEVGAGVQGIKVGDQVACTGSTFASHAEIVSVPHTLCVPVPDGVDGESAAFVALGGIALHAVRVSGAALGENVAVIGLGLLGLLAVQLLKATGCRVLGTDPDPGRCDLARELGCDATAASPVEFQTLAESQTALQGCDATLIFAATTSNQPIELSAEITREQGRVVVPGLVGLDIPRKIFYEKELDLRISRAWGPGMYDLDYEAGKVDYPYSFVRWTAGRNMSAFLDLVAQGKVRLDRLITHHFPIERALEAYDLITKGGEPFIGVVLTYPNADKQTQPDRIVTLKKSTHRSTLALSKVEGLNTRPSTASIGFIGAGNFAKATLFPALKGLAGAHLQGLADISGANAQTVAEKYGFSYCTTDYQELLADEGVNTIMVATPHNSHAPLAIEALKAGKHIYVEKPLAITRDQLGELIAAYQEATVQEKIDIRGNSSNSWQEKEIRATRPEPGRRDPCHPWLMVGFNRRFSPFSVTLKEWLSFTDFPMVLNCRVNAGYVPPERWEQDPQVGGGRIIGEVCHFVDLFQYFSDANPVEVYAQTMKAAGQYLSQDNLVITVKMNDGSVGTITYTASGDKAFPRERIEIFRAGAVGLIDNFRSASFIHQGSSRSKKNRFGIDRGHNAEIAAFVAAVSGKESALPTFESLIYTTLTTFAIEESLKGGKPVSVRTDELLMGHP